jgi:hypothetical protein
MPYRDPEKAREAARRQYHARHKDPEYRERDLARKRANNKKYFASPEGKAAYRRYWKSPLGKENRRRMCTSPLGKEAAWRYWHSPKGTDMRGRINALMRKRRATDPEYRERRARNERNRRARLKEQRPLT